jgi:guanyl-specific ribonuclease Sa
MCYKRRSQGIVEAGIFGTVVLVAFAFLITFVQKMNGEQYTLMENFRQSLKKSHDSNKVISHVTLDDSRQADLEAPARRQKIMRSASGYVHWAIPSVNRVTTTIQLQDSPVERSWVSDESESGGGHWYYHQGVQFRIDEENDPKRKFVYYINSRDEELSPDANVNAVNTEYVTEIAEEFVVAESPSAISTNRSTGVSEEMTYKIKDAKTVEQTRYDNVSRSFGVSK